MECYLRSIRGVIQYLKRAEMVANSHFFASIKDCCVHIICYIGSLHKVWCLPYSVRRRAALSCVICKKLHMMPTGHASLRFQTTFSMKGALRQEQRSRNEQRVWLSVVTFSQLHSPHRPPVEPEWMLSRQCVALHLGFRVETPWLQLLTFRETLKKESQNFRLRSCFVFAKDSTGIKTNKTYSSVTVMGSFEMHRMYV